MEGSESKLSSFRDGFKILKMIAMLMKETKPFVFFSYVATALLAVSAIIGTPVVLDYFATGLVDRIPTWILSMTLLLGAMITLAAGTILDSVARGRAEQKRIHYLSISPARGEKATTAIPLRERRSQSEEARISIRGKA